jgi:hypothetical protein
MKSFKTKDVNLKRFNESSKHTNAKAVRQKPRELEISEESKRIRAIRKISNTDNKIWT